MLSQGTASDGRAERAAVAAVAMDPATEATAATADFRAAVAVAAVDA